MSTPRLYETADLLVELGQTIRQLETALEYQAKRIADLAADGKAGCAQFVSEVDSYTQARAELAEVQARYSSALAGA